MTGDMEAWDKLGCVRKMHGEPDGPLSDCGLAVVYACAMPSLSCLPQGRQWWRDAHLLPQPAVTVAEALQAGAANPAALLAQGAVAAFLHPLWQQHVVQEWR